MAKVPVIMQLEALECGAASLAMVMAYYEASVNKQAVKANKTDLLIGKIPLLLTDIANYGVLVLGVYITIQGEYTLGGVMMFQGFLSSFMTPAQTLVTAGQTI